jgi:hypothetical protein
MPSLNTEGLLLFDAALAWVRETPSGAPSLTIVNPHFEAGQFRLSFDTVNGQPYVVEYKNDLSPGNWSPLETVTGTGGQVTVSDSSPDPARRFYRVRLGP